MLIRAYKLRKNITEFTETQSDIKNVSNDEWKYIDYLIKILHSFCVFINVISVTVNYTII